jgi:hypothetical protein
MKFTPEQHVKRYDRLKAERAQWDQSADDVATYISPRKSILTKYTPGEIRTEHVYETTAQRAAQFCASGIYSYTVQGQQWFALKPRNKALADRDEVKRWFATVSEELLGHIMSSNFPRAVYEGLQDFVTMPAMCLYLEEGGKEILNFQAFAFGSYVVKDNADGIVDTIYRAFKLTPRQAVQKWGKEALHPKMIEALNDDKKCDTQYDFLHYVAPRENYDESKKDKLNMPFASCYIDVKHKHEVSEGGYAEFPYFIGRFAKNPEEVYGHSPGMDILPDVRGINKMKQTILIAGEKMVNPPWLIPDDGSSSYKFSSRAGSMNYWRANGVSNQKPEPVQINHNLPVGLEMINGERQIIEQAFFLDLFNMLANYDKTMTATEVMQRVEEKLNSFAPTWSNLQSEIFGPIIHRAFGILARNGILPDAPRELEFDPSYDVTYLSKIALAAQMLKARAYFQYVEAVTPLMAANPEAGAAFNDTVNLPKAYRELAYNMGLPIDWTYSVEEAEQKAQARAQAQQQAMAMQQLEQGAGALGKLPEQAQEQVLKAI